MREGDGLGRRDFLRCMAWAGTALVWTVEGGVLRARALADEGTAPRGEGFRFVQISDTHLGFHGAANPDATETFGLAIARIRAVAPRVPIAVGLDFHSHMTAAMVDNATVIAGYCTYPHVDMGDTGQRAGRTMLRALRGEVEPVMVWGSLPMMTSTLVHAPSRQPMKDVMDMAMAAEASGAVLNASVFGGFPHSDIPHVSLSTVIVCDRRTDAGLALRDRLLAMAWERREEFLYRGAPLAGQIAHARSLSEGPIVLVDHGDNTASGGTQDVMSVIEEVMRQGLTDVVAGPICDPAGVRRLPMFPEVEALPRAQHQRAAGDRNRKVHGRQRGADMGRHIVVTFRRMDKQPVAVGNEAGEERL